MTKRDWKYKSKLLVRLLWLESLNGGEVRKQHLERAIIITNKRLLKLKP